MQSLIDDFGVDPNCMDAARQIWFSVLTNSGVLSSSFIRCERHAWNVPCRAAHCGCIMQVMLQALLLQWCFALTWLSLWGQGRSCTPLHGTVLPWSALVAALPWPRHCPCAMTI